jgi:hypothetical protein
MLAATPQEPDILIFENDTIYLDKYPLEELVKIRPDIGQRLSNTNCISTGCWRKYIATWKIIENRLCLLELRSPCTRKIIPLKKIFTKSEINDDVILASWYTSNITAGFGKFIEFSEAEFRNLYEKTISIKVAGGVVNSIDISSE